MQTVPEDTTCTRCQGDGIIKGFQHVLGGVCFRCWGTGIDPITVVRLQDWLARARREYRSRRSVLWSLSDGDQRRQKLVEALESFEKTGKQVRTRLDRLEGSYEENQMLVKGTVRRSA